MKEQIELTPAAAGRVRALQEERGAGDLQLRVLVEPGGCSGLEYGMTFDRRKDGDTEVESNGVRFLVDGASLTYLEGSVIHFDDGLNGKGFEFRNPRAQATCGCGRSFN